MLSCFLQLFYCPIISTSLFIYSIYLVNGYYLELISMLLCKYLTIFLNYLQIIFVIILLVQLIQCLFRGLKFISNFFLFIQYIYIVKFLIFNTFKSNHQFFFMILFFIIPTSQFLIFQIPVLVIFFTNFLLFFINI